MKSPHDPMARGGDRVAILLSGLCLLHCAVFPLVLVSLPWLTWFVDHDSVVHRWLLVAIVPVSAYALIRGCLRHQRYLPVWVGLASLALLLIASFGEIFSTVSETTMTMIGSVCLSVGHFLNLRGLKKTIECGELSDEAV